MRNTKQITIESVNYELVEMLATKRSIIGLTVKNIILGIKDGIGNVKDGIDTEINYTKLFTGLLERIDPEKGAYLLRDIILSGVQFPVLDNDRYDEHFGEFYHHQIQLVSEIMKMNFGKSIDEIKKKLEQTGILGLIFSKETE